MFTRQLEKLWAFQKSIIPVQINFLQSYYDKQAGASLKSLIFRFFYVAKALHMSLNLILPPPEFLPRVDTLGAAVMYPKLLSLSII